MLIKCLNCISQFFLIYHAGLDLTDSQWSPVCLCPGGDGAGSAAGGAAGRAGAAGGWNWNHLSAAAQTQSAGQGHPEREGQGGHPAQCNTIQSILYVSALNTSGDKSTDKCVHVNVMSWMACEVRICVWIHSHPVTSVCTFWIGTAHVKSIPGGTFCHGPFLHISQQKVNMLKLVFCCCVTNIPNDTPQNIGVNHDFGEPVHSKCADSLNISVISIDSLLRSPMTCTAYSVKKLALLKHKAQTVFTLQCPAALVLQ